MYTMKHWTFYSPVGFPGLVGFPDYLFTSIATFSLSTYASVWPIYSEGYCTMPPTPKRQLKCGQCAQHYSSVSHLRRHEATHSSKRPAACPFCERRFLRSDVLLRHSRTCKQKGNHPVGPVKRGRKRKACDRCAIGRVSCDGDSPCEACLARGFDCSYGYVEQLQTILYNSHDQGVSKPNQVISNSQRIPISFLLNCTDPSLQSPHDFHRVLAGTHDLIRPAWLTETWPSLFHTFVDDSAWDPSSHGSELYGLHSPELTRTSETLMLCLENASVTGVSRTGFNRTARSFFSEDSIRRYVTAFFENAYHSNPFIHKASFDVNAASPLLVIAILLLGSTCVSPEDASAAGGYCDLIESLVFEGPEFLGILCGRKDHTISIQTVQLLQAAILTIQLQGSQQEVTTKRRIRVQRIPALVFVVRLLNLTRVVNDDIQTLEGYVNKETLVRIMAGVYLLDSYSVIFYHSPPQLRLYEASFGLPMQDTIFETVGQDDQGHTLSDHTPLPPLTLQSVVQLLMDSNPFDPEEIQSRIDSLFGHFLILTGNLHFHSTLDLGYP
ncbi:hypothetical protein BJX99DRAFT_224720 [Aspergillus californicus]